MSSLLRFLIDVSLRGILVTTATVKNQTGSGERDSEPASGRGGRGILQMIRDYSDRQHLSIRQGTLIVEDMTAEDIIAPFLFASDPVLQTTHHRPSRLEHFRALPQTGSSNSPRYEAPLSSRAAIVSELEIPCHPFHRQTLHLCTPHPAASRSTRLSQSDSHL